MASCRILSVSVLLLLLLVGQQEVKGSNIWQELEVMYGPSNGPIIAFSLRLIFGSTTTQLDSQLNQMKLNGQLSSLCRYVDQTWPNSCSPPSSSSSESLKEIASHLTAECCQVVNGEWGSWTYGACSTTCGGGTQTRTRLCNSPAPANGGRNCPGNNSEQVSCNTQSCPAVDGEWGSWTYGSCSAPCGGGTLTRTRRCDSPAPANGGRDCPGFSSELITCNSQSCFVHGEWGSWTYGACSATCGGGTQTRTRRCDSPAPASGGRDCPGNNNEQVSCNTQSCPAVVNGEWGSWTYGACSTTCGGGTQIRTRRCDSPAPANGGSNCPGSNYERVSCNTHSCIVHGEWGNWMYGICSTTCGGGTQIRTRRCDSPAPANGGRNCLGSNYERVSCNTQSCPAVVNGEWGSWTSGDCSVTCGGGTLTRTRRCDSPAPANGGSDCPGLSSEEQRCNTQGCPTRKCSLRSVAGKIDGGNPAKPGEYPWLARLLLNGVAECGAVIVSNSYVLTAGHCLLGRMTDNVLTDRNIEVVAGQFQNAVNPLEDGAQRVSVVRGIRHSDYNSVLLLNDIAVLGLDPPLEYNSVVSNICLPDRTSTLPPQCTVAGWGRESFAGQVTPTLYEVEVDVYNRSQCLETFPPSVSGDDYSIYTNDGSMCAANGTSGGKDACEGDSGSGLMCYTTDATGQYLQLMGIVSSGYKCAEPGVPGLYVYVPYFIDWINQTIETLQAQAAASNSG